ncbi:MAG: hypothetical protein QM536_07765 [Chitinophagaceae bacterium]|nr:hypothetical protein [Chitinophagaceae bacterium]
MKKRIVIVVFLHMGFLSSAQTVDSVKVNKYPSTLFGGYKLSHTSWGGFGAPIIEVSSLDGNVVASVGGAGAALINRVFFFGGYGLNSLGNVSKEINGISQNYRLSHGGLYTGVIIKPNWLLHFIVSGKFGSGSVSTNGNDRTDGGHHPAAVSSLDYRDRVFVFTPQVDVQLNIHKYIRLNAGVGYRLVTGVDETFFSKTAFNSMSYNFGIFFGKFH